MSVIAYVPCGCKAHLSEKDPRAPIWMYVFGCLEFPLKHPIPHMKTGEGKFLEGDWRALSIDQQQRLCEKMKKKFGITELIFKGQILNLGFIPIKDENIIVTVCNLHFRCMI